MRTEILKELVAIPSPSGREEVIAGYIAEKSDGPGRSVTRLGNNVVVHIPGAGRPDRALLLNGHIDTVPPTEEWTVDPFVLQPDPEDDDKLIGLGASDMKAGLAIMLGIGEEAAGLPYDLFLLYSAGEETENSGAPQVAEWLAERTRNRYRTIGGLILEPTGAEFVGVGHRGDTVWDVLARGPGGHASQDFTGELPAIEKVCRLIAALQGIRQEWIYHYTDDLLGAPSINATIIGSGQTENVIPGQATATLNLRVTPRLAATLPEIRKALEHEYDLTLHQRWEPAPTLCRPDEYIYQVTKAALPGTPFRAFPGATDQFAFHAHNMPMLILGPGTDMHVRDESVRLSAIVRCEEMIHRIMQKF